MISRLNLSNLDMGLIAIEGIVIFSLILLTISGLKGMNKKRIKEETLYLEPLKNWVKEGETICERLLQLTKGRGGVEAGIFETKDVKKPVDLKIKNESLFYPSFQRDLPYRGTEIQILRMAEAGYDIFEIAKNLGLSPGEIRFTLDWLKYRQSINR
jgi:hypothetical protein